MYIPNHLLYKYSINTDTEFLNTLEKMFVALSLTLIMLNYLNGIIHLPFSALSFIILMDIMMKTYSWSANSIELGQTARWQKLITFGVGRIRIKKD